MSWSLDPHSCWNLHCCSWIWDLTIGRSHISSTLASFPGEAEQCDNNNKNNNKIIISLPFLKKGTMFPVCQSITTVPDLHVALKKHVNQDNNVWSLQHLKAKHFMVSEEAGCSQVTPPTPPEGFSIIAYMQILISQGDYRVLGCCPVQDPTQWLQKGSQSNSQSLPLSNL